MSAALAILKGKRILLTRDKADNARWAAELTSLGAIPVELACIRVEPLNVAAELQAAVDEADWIVLGSRRAAAALNPIEIVSPHVQIACVGPATRAALNPEHRAAAESFTPPEGGTMASLAAGLQEQLATDDPQDILEIAPVKGRGQLAERFAPTPHRLTRVNAYATHPAQTDAPARPLEELTGGPVDAALFASPSAIRGLLNIAELPQALPCVAVGPTTQDALRQAGLLPVGEAATRDLHGLLTALSAHFEGKPS